MSNRAVFFSLIVALVLGALAVAVLWGPAGDPRDTQPIELLALPVAGVRSIEIQTSERHEVVARTDLGWFYESGKGERWPVDEDRVVTALRLLKSRTLTPGDPPPSAEGAGVVRVLGPSGSLEGSIELTLWPERVGGRAPARLDAAGATHDGWVEGDLVELLLGTGAGPWRSGRAIPLGLDDPRSIRIEAAGGTIALDRDAGRWFMRQPREIEAEAEAVRALIAALSRVRVQGFEPVPIDGSLDSPWLRVAIARGSQNGTDAGLRVMLEVGATLDLAETTYAGRVTASEGSTAIVPARTLTLAAEGLAGLTLAPEQLARRTLAGAPAGEVSRIALTRPDAAPATYTRSLGGWTDANAREVPRPVREALEAILGFACTTPADAISFDSDGPLMPIGGIGLQLRQGDSVLIELLRGESGEEVVGEVDGVRRVFSGPAAGLLIEAIVAATP